MENGNTVAVDPTLPPKRKAMAESSITNYVNEYHAVATERDALQRENFALKEALQLSKIACEGQTTQLTEEKSKAETAMLVRDKAVADCTKWKTLFIQLNATMRAFMVEHAPLMTDTDEDQYGRDVRDPGRSSSDIG